MRFATSTAGLGRLGKTCTFAVASAIANHEYLIQTTNCPSKMKVDHDVMKCDVAFCLPEVCPESKDHCSHESYVRR